MISSLAEIPLGENPPVRDLGLLGSAVARPQRGVIAARFSHDLTTVRSRNLQTAKRRPTAAPTPWKKLARRAPVSR